jgi:prevent-host-death family protein
LAARFESCPASSISNDRAVVIGAHEFRERFGYWMDRAAAGDELIVTRRGKPIVHVSGTR